MIENIILPCICQIIFLLLHLHKTHLLTQERRTRGRDKIKQKPSLHSPQSWIPDSRYWMPVFVSGAWILDSNRWWDSGFLEWYCGF